MDYLFIAYSVTWVIIAAYIVVLGKRQKEIAKEMKQIEEWKSEV